MRNDSKMRVQTFELKKLSTLYNVTRETINDDVNESRDRKNEEENENMN